MHRDTKRIILILIAPVAAFWLLQAFIGSHFFSGQFSDYLFLQIAAPCAVVRLLAIVLYVVPSILIVLAIEQRSRVKAVLTESEERYRELVRHMSGCVAVYEVQDEGRRFVFREFNEAAERVDGIARKEVIGREVREVFPGVVPFGLIEVFERVWRTGVSEEFPVHLYQDAREIGWRENFVYKLPTGEIVAIYDDVTERKRAEQSLRESEGRVQRKLDALLAPEGDIGELSLRDVMDVVVVQKLMEDFYRVTGAGMALLDMEGRVLVSVGWQDICAQFHRVHPETRRHCLESDTELSHGVEPGTFKLYHCKNNMWDMVTPIVVGGKHLGNLFLGQFFFDDEVLDEALFRRQAQQYGFDEKAYLEALHRVPRWSHERVERIMALYAKLSHMLSSLSFANISQARMIDERDRLLSSVRESEARFRGTFEQAAVGVAHVALDGRWMKVNQKICDIVGYAQDELIGKTFQDITHPDDLETDLAYVRQMIAGTIETYAMEKRYFRKDGSIVWINLTVSLIRDGRGEPDYFVAVVEDITRRKRVEQSLRESEKQYRGIFESARDAVLIFDMDGVICEANPAACVMYGYSYDALIGLSGTNIVHPDCRGVFARFREAILKGESFKSESIDVRKGGEYFPIEVYGSAYEYRGQPHMLAVARDITDRKRAEEMLKASESFLKRIMDESPFAMWVSDEKGTMTRSNRALRESAGLTDAQLIGRYNVCKDENLIQQGLMPLVQRVMEKHEPVRFRMFWAGTRIAHADFSGARDMHIDVSMFPIVNAEGVLTNVVCQWVDVTEEVLGAEQLQRYANEMAGLVEARTKELDEARADLFASSKLAAMGRLGAGVAHQLSSPICGALLHVEAANARITSDAKATALLQRAKASLISTRDIIDGMLSLAGISRWGEFHQVSIDFGSMLDRIAKAIVFQCDQQQVKVLFERPNEPIVKEAIVGELDQIFLNIVNNAVDAMPQGGDLTIVARMNGEEIAVAITDTGEGIAPDVMDRLFEPFYSTRLDRRGVGLGLPIARDITERYGGRIEVKSEQGQGSTFTVILPLVGGRDVEVSDEG